MKDKKRTRAESSNKEGKSRRSKEGKIKIEQREKGKALMNRVNIAIVYRWYVIGCNFVYSLQYTFFS